MAMAIMCANSDPRLLATMHDFKVLPTATIVASPDTVGLADSNLMRLTSTADIDQELEMMQSIGVTDIRIGLFWSQIEPAEGQFDWSTADYVINRANQLGMGVLAVLNQTPAWAGTPVDAGTPSTTDFANYATAITQRYQGKISAIEIWNEPNSVTFLDPLSPANYTALLQAGYTAIKAVDPSITVIGGVLGEGVSAGNATMSPQDFLQGMYTAGAHGYFDALSFHPYDNTVMYSDQSNSVLTPKGQLQAMQALMAQYGDAAKQIWATEYGLPTGTASNEVSQQQQADFIANFLNSWGEQAGVGPIFIYTTRDIDTGDGQAQDNYGIWETDWTPKQVVQVIQDFIASQTVTSSPSGNPIVAAVKNFVVQGAQLLGAVIKGAVNATVTVVKAIATTVVTVVAAATKVAVNIAQGIGNAIKGVVNAVVGGIEHIFGGGAAATAAAAAFKATDKVAAAELPVTQKAAKKSTTAVSDAPTVAERKLVKKGKGKKAGDDQDGTTVSPDAVHKPWADKRGKGHAETAALTTDPAATDTGTTGSAATDSGKTGRSNHGGKHMRGKGEHRSGSGGNVKVTKHQSKAHRGN